jgi:hypothetical protein
MMNDDECEAGGGMIGRGNISTRRKPAPIPICLLQIPHDLTWDKTRGSSGGKPATNLYSVTCSDESRYLHSDSAKSSYCRHTYSPKQRKFPRRRARASYPRHVQGISHHAINTRPHPNCTTARTPSGHHENSSGYA